MLLTFTFTADKYMRSSKKQKLKTNTFNMSQQLDT